MSAGSRWRIALLLLFVAAYADPLLLRRNFAGRDLLAYNLPMEKAIHDAYSRGRLPVWMAEISGGRPLQPNPNAGALYPVRPLLAKIRFPVAMRIFPPLHWALAALGVFQLLSALGASRAAAWTGAVTYAFSGVAVSEVFYLHILPGLALLPWILWAIARPWASQRGRVLTLAAFFALEMLAGDVFSIALSGSAALLWVLLEEERSLLGRSAVALGAGLALASLAAAPQIVATMFWVSETARAVTGMKLSESLLFTLRPPRLLELLVPFPFGATFALDASQVWGRAVFFPKGTGLFETIYCGAFAFLGAVSFLRARSRGSRFALGFLLLALLGASLPSLVPSAWLRFQSPVALRNPEKFAVGIVFALSVLAGLAFDRFRSQPPARRALLAGAAVLALAAGAAWVWPAAARSLVPGVPVESATVEGRKFAVALAEGGLLFVATLFAVEALRSRRAASGAIAAAILTAVLLASNRRIAPSFAEDAVFGPTPFARRIATADPNGMYRTMGVYGYRPASEIERVNSSNDPGKLEYNRRSWSDYMPVLWGRGLVFNWDFDAGDLSRLNSLRRLSLAAAAKPDAGAFFGDYALRWSVHFRDQDALPGYHRIAGNPLMDLDEHEMAWPDVRLLTGWRETPGAIEAFNSLLTLAPGHAAIETGASVEGHARPGRLRIVEKTPERLRVIAEAPDPTWLFVLRGFWTHRTVLLDGEPVEDAPAQVAFSAVRVPAGTHRIEWTEEIPGGGVTRWGPLLAVLLALLWTARDRAARRAA